jgi:hypothetical protein
MGAGKDPFNRWFAGWVEMVTHLGNGIHQLDDGYA